MNVGETWVAINDVDCECRIEKIDDKSVWCSAPWFNKWFPTCKEVFLKSMRRKVLVTTETGIEVRYVAES